MIVQSTQIPDDSLLLHTPRNYEDAFSGFIPDSQLSPLDLALLFGESAPSWVEKLFGFRNWIVGFFGLKTGEGQFHDREAAIRAFGGEPGEQLGFFKVFDHSDKEIILGEDDKHLDFRVSLYAQPENSGTRFIISTTVTFHNLWGKLYFLPVRPFHKLIVPTMMKRMIRIHSEKINNQRKKSPPNS